MLAWLATQFARVVPEDAAHAHAEHLLTQLQGAAVMAHAFADPSIVTRQTANARTWLHSVLAADQTLQNQ